MKPKPPAKITEAAPVMRGHLILDADLPILAGPPQLSGKRVEVVRSFSYKMNMGNYESRDFFMSQKSECAAEEAAEVSERVYQFVKSQVLASVRQYRAEADTQYAAIKERKSA